MIETLVRDIMVTLEEYPCISETLTLRDAITEMAVQILRKKQVSLPRAALVFDDDFLELRGVLRRRDIMRGLEPAFLAKGALKFQRRLFNVKIDPNLAELSYDKLIEHIRKRADQPVKKYVTPISATIFHDDHITKAIYTMVDQNTSLLPVMENGNVIGVVRSVDVLSEIALIISP